MANYTQLQHDNIQQITCHYDLTFIESEPIEGGAANSSFVLHTRQGNYVLTIFEQKTLGDVFDIGNLLLLLANYNVPTTRVLCTKHGQIATLYQDKPVMLKPYIEGQVCKNLDGEMLAQIGVEMAKLHQIPAPNFLPTKHYYGRQLFSSVIGCNVSPSYESWLGQQLARLERNIPAGLPRTLIHGDLFFDNVLFEGKKFKAILDFESACYYDRVFDLGMAITGLCVADTTLQLAKARAFVKGYQHMQQLKAIEKETLQLFIEYAATATSYWRFWKYHIDALRPAKAHKHLQMMHIAENVKAISKTEFLETVF